MNPPIPNPLPRGGRVYPFAFMAVFAACVLVLTSCGLGSRPGAAGSVAPPYSFETWDGQSMSQEDFAGQAVVLNFWASWCIPCREEMPAFQSLYVRYREQGVAVVGIAVEDDPVLARKFVGDLGITYPTGSDFRNQTFQRFQVIGLPTTLFIGRDGKIARRWDGALNEQQLEAIVRELVGVP